uniref:UDP-glucuronosyltransferase 2C1 n=1 Tax=Ceratitis capitata TaxID=7213 RepID=W8BNH9_CERCA
MRCSIALLALVFCAFVVPPANAARILGFFPSPSRSHLLIHCAVADTLARAGHNVTVIATKPNMYPKAPYNYIQLDTPLLPDTFMNVLVNDPPPFYKRYPMLLSEVTKMNNRTLSHPDLQEFLRNHGEDAFDLLLLGYFGNEFHLGLGAHFKCPVVISFMMQPFFVINELIGNPSEHAYVPTLFSGLKQPMDFWARLQNYLTTLFEYYYMSPMLERAEQKYYSYNFPTSSGYPSLEEARHNVALIFANHWFTQGPVRPNVPNLIEIGGIQIKQHPDPLPADIAELLDGSPEGVIYFSLGSNIQGKHLQADKARIMYSVVSKLPYKVLWQWGDSGYPGNSSNIVYKNWLPQSDVLAHPNVKLFITHGGKGSVVESQYHGVPMVGIPLFGDQPVNVLDVQQLGMGVYVSYADLTEERLRQAVEEVLHNPKYTETVRNFSKLYRDRPMTAHQTVVWWVDYVLRHKGAFHMQSPAVYMKRWQLMSLDVLGFLLTIIITVISLALASVYWLAKRCRGGMKGKTNIKNGVTKAKKVK